MKKRIVDESKAEEEGYPIAPGHIGIDEHFFEAFGNTQTEVSARWIVRLCQDRGGWLPFTKEEIDAFGKHKFCFNRLNSGRVDCADDFVVLCADGLYRVTHEFIATCFLWSPVTASKYWGYVEAKVLPVMPESIQVQTEGEESELQPGEAVVIGGLSLVGDRGSICRTVTLLSGDGENLFGWSLTLGMPGQPETFYRFSMAEPETMKGIEIPNVMTYFQAKVDPRLIDLDVPPDNLDAVAAYVLPHISDAGPPPSA